MKDISGAAFLLENIANDLSIHPLCLRLFCSTERSLITFTFLFTNRGIFIIRYAFYTLPTTGFLGEFQKIEEKS
jgi:hypothetical protein